MSGKISVETCNPSHYNIDGFIESIDRFRSVPANFGCADRYISRLGLKGGDNTEARDSKAAIWYCFDLMAMLLDEDEGEFRPAVEDYQGFDSGDFVTSVLKYMADYEAATGLRYSDSYEKAFVLAAMQRLIRQYDNAVKVGMSDRQYRDFVLETLVTAYLVINYAYQFSQADSLWPLYKGSKSFPYAPELVCAVKDTFGSVFALGVEARAGLGLTL